MTALARLNAMDDAALIEAAIAGDDRAFSTLYRRYARTIAGIVVRLIGQDAEVDDVIQQTFIEASDGLATLRDPAAFRGWLARIAVRRVQRRLLRRYRWQRLTRAVAIVHPQVTTPAAQAEVHALYEVLERLPPQVRIPWFLHHIEGEQLTEVARMCDVSLATVKRRIAEGESLVQRGLHA